MRSKESTQRVLKFHLIMGSVVSNSTKRRSKINYRTLYQLEIYYSGRVDSILSRVHLARYASRTLNDHYLIRAMLSIICIYSKWLQKYLIIRGGGGGGGGGEAFAPPPLPPLVSILTPFANFLCRAALDYFTIFSWLGVPGFSRASEQGKVISLVSLYMCVYKIFLI